MERNAAAYGRSIEVLTGAFVELMRFAAERPAPMNARTTRLYARLANTILCQFGRLRPSAPPVQPPAERIAGG
jgi:hypothetical protein